MCPINVIELHFDHIVEFSKDHTIFAAARENGNGHLRIFLIYEATGNVYTRNGRADSWEQVLGSDRRDILAKVSEARKSNVPTYKINGSNGSQI